MQTEQNYLLTAGGQRSGLLSERAQLLKQADNITRAIAEHGLSDLLSEQLRMIEPKLREIARRLEAPAPTLQFDFSRKEIEEFVEREAWDFSEALTADRSAARQEIQKRIRKLVLTPSKQKGVTFDVTGDVQLLAAPDDGMLSNSLGRIAQHYNGSRVSLEGVVLHSSFSF
ncbi:MAG: hypothetical protein JWO13_3286 [Acidobacteriales bacterium]|nr:hypothetical protein [Terriglobales bacterium]